MLCPLLTIGFGQKAVVGTLVLVELTDMTLGI